MAGFLSNKSTLDAISRVVSERVGGGSSGLTIGRVEVNKSRWYKKGGRTLGVGLYRH
jgi:hypothetical protein